ncbi:MAG: SlyX family protein [Puniceicoccales bacterium]|nr:SlyX family protein [Puniceicoccales bacterium]
MKTAREANSGDDGAARARSLEVKLAFLERHVEEQDRVMLDHFRELDRLRREVERLSEITKAAVARDAGTPAVENEKPPHY